MISGPDRFSLHRPIELVVAFAGLIIASPVLLISWIAAAHAAQGSGLFRQTRIGRGGQPFEVIKFRTMYAGSSGTTVTIATDNRITSVGRLLRRSKLDELPQLFNVVRGEMALLGPRPDVPGFADALEGENRAILTVRPGITGPASLACIGEEELLASASDPESFNRDVLYPLKTAINLAWIRHGSLGDDLRLLLWTVRPPSAGSLDAMINRWIPTLSLDALQPME